MAAKDKSIKVLSIDIGGTGTKATVLDHDGNMLVDRKRLKTPHPALPDKLLGTISKLVNDFPEFDYVAAGFPGFIRRGVVQTAPNLGNELWNGVNLGKRLAELFKKQVRLINDADLQGLGVVRGSGLEMVITLGTGFGTALLQDGHLLPHLELSHHPISKKRNYDEYVGKKALKDKGNKKWNKRMKKVLKVLKTVINYDRLYISGGNADKLDFKLDNNISIVSNTDGIKGGAVLWKVKKDDLCVTTSFPPK